MGLNKDLNYLNQFLIIFEKREVILKRDKPSLSFIQKFQIVLFTTNLGSNFNSFCFS